jgi:hypothetical protein
LDLSEYNKSPKALLSNTYGISYSTTGGGKKPKKSRKLRRSRRRKRKSSKKRRRSRHRSRVKRGGRVQMPARYFDSKNFETYKGGGFIRDVANAFGYKDNAAKIGYEFVNGQKTLNFNKTGNPLNEALHANKQASTAQAGGGDWLNTADSHGPINTPNMPEAQFRMFNKTSPYMTNEQLAPGAVGGKAACLGDKPIYAANAFNGVSVLGGGGKKRKSRRRRRKSRKSRKSKSRSRRSRSRSRSKSRSRRSRSRSRSRRRR